METVTIALLRGGIYFIIGIMFFMLMLYVYLVSLSKNKSNPKDDYSNNLDMDELLSSRESYKTNNENSNYEDSDEDDPIRRL